jgi:hypothetical protein
MPCPFHPPYAWQRVEVMPTVTLMINHKWSGEHSSVSRATGYAPDGSDSIPGRGNFFSSPQLPGRLWGPPSLLSSGYRGPFSGEYAAGVWIWPLTSN